MKTVLYRHNGVDQTFTQVSKVDFKATKPGHVAIHSAKDGIHEIPIDDLISID